MPPFPNRKGKEKGLHLSCDKSTRDLKVKSSAREVIHPITGSEQLLNSYQAWLPVQYFDSVCCVNIRK
ncbi:hypothetical protein SESBI_13447 [Sesbania bispinosa]|nr:hypothetical protein SESBI_13447 [Sesbania bispinosa]